jgi:hypothetical protein
MGKFSAAPCVLIVSNTFLQRNPPFPSATLAYEAGTTVFESVNEYNSLEKYAKLKSGVLIRLLLYPYFKNR